MICKTVFIVSEDPAVRESLSGLVVSVGLRAETLPSLEAWFEDAGLAPQGCLVLDTNVGDLVDLQRRARLASACARIPVLVLTDRGDVPMAVHTIKQGAADVLQKPFSDRNLLKRIRRALEENGNIDT